MEDTEVPVGDLSGANLDAAIHRELFGHRTRNIHLLGRQLAEHSRNSAQRVRDITLPWMAPLDTIPRYSSKCHDTLKVLDTLGWWGVDQLAPNGVVAAVVPRRGSDDSYAAVGDTFGEAICRAALLSVRSE